MAFLFLSVLELFFGVHSPAVNHSQHKTASLAARPPAKGIKKVGHVIVLYMENHSFDNLYGEFPGANGLANATPAEYTQVDTAGTPYNALPWSDTAHFHPIPLFSNRPFNIDQYVPPTSVTLDLTHRYYQEIAQIDGGKMDKYAAISNAKGLTMGYYHTMHLPVPVQEATEYTLCDHFFHSAFGGSWLNHIWLIAAATPQWNEAPASIRAILENNGNLLIDGSATPDGYLINTVFSVNQPHPHDATILVPNLTLPTIGDRLSAAHVDWAWYGGGYSSAIEGHPDPLFQFHHQPFLYFKNYADGTDAKAKHLKDENDFISDLIAGTLPPVSFVKPIGELDEHPGYANVMEGEKHLEDLITLIRNSPEWKDCVLIVTYDEHGGFWDHVAPPKIDRWGPGTRVPALIISPFAKKHFVDHTQYETVSILSFIEKRWKLKPLSSRDAKANPFTNALEF